MLVWKLWTVYARMFAVTAILSCVIKIRGLFKSTKWRHFENVKFEALSARRDILISLRLVQVAVRKKTRVNDNMSIRSQRCLRVSEPFNLSCPLKKRKKEKQKKNNRNYSILFKNNDPSFLPPIFLLEENQFA